MQKDFDIKGIAGLRLSEQSPESDETEHANAEEPLDILDSANNLDNASGSTASSTRQEATVDLSANPNS